MKVRLCSFSTLTILLLLFANSSSAGEPAGAEDAKGLLADAVAYMEKVGPTKAFCAFNDRTGRFHKGPLYVFVINMDGVYFAHSAAPSLVGTSLRDLRDADGKLFGKTIMELVTTKGEGSVDYKFTNYASGKVENKHTFVKKVGDWFVLGAGYYSQ